MVRCRLCRKVRLCFWVSSNSFVFNISNITTVSISNSISYNLCATIGKLDTVFTVGSIPITVFIGSKISLCIVIMHCIAELVDRWSIIGWLFAICRSVDWCMISRFSMNDGFVNNGGYIWGRFVDNGGYIWGRLMDDWGMIWGRLVDEWGYIWGRLMDNRSMIWGRFVNNWCMIGSGVVYRGRFVNRSRLVSWSWVIKGSWFV